MDPVVNKSIHHAYYTDSYLVISFSNSSCRSWFNKLSIFDTYVTMKLEETNQSGTKFLTNKLDTVHRKRESYLNNEIYKRHTICQKSPYSVE